MFFIARYANLCTPKTTAKKAFIMKGKETTRGDFNEARNDIHRQILSAVSHEAYIRICDNGPGIVPERMEDIFSKYTRFSKSDQQNAGTGLGLPIRRQIMRLLSGSVNVENRPEGGATFTLKFSSQ
jgi:signal transduction histidine kinase